MSRLFDQRIERKYSVYNTDSWEEEKRGRRGVGRGGGKKDEERREERGDEKLRNIDHCRKMDRWPPVGESE